MKKQKKKKEEKRRRKYLLPGIELGNFYAPVRFATTTPLLKNPWWYQFISKAFDRALLNTNSKILFRRGTTVLTVKTERKRISSHLKNRFQADMVWTRLAASKTCFVTSIFAHILRLIVQNRFHLFLKKVLFSKFIAKSTYRLLKWPQKIKPIEIWPKQGTLRCCLETQNAP